MTSELGSNANVPRSVFKVPQRHALKSPDKTTSRILAEIDEDFHFLRVSDDVKDDAFTPLVTSTEKRPINNSSNGEKYSHTCDVNENFLLRPKKQLRYQQQRAAATQTNDDLISRHDSLDLLPLDTHPTLSCLQVRNYVIGGVGVIDVMCQAETCTSASYAREHVKERFLSASQPSLLSLDDVIYGQATSTSCENLLVTSSTERFPQEAHKGEEEVTSARIERKSVNACTIATQTSVLVADDDVTNIDDVRSARVNNSDSIRRQVTELSEEVKRLKQLIQLNRTPDDDVTVREAPIGARIIRSHDVPDMYHVTEGKQAAIANAYSDQRRVNGRIGRYAKGSFVDSAFDDDVSDDSFFASQPLKSSTPRGAVALKRSGSFRRLRPSPEGSVGTAHAQKVAAEHRQSQNSRAHKLGHRPLNTSQASHALIDELKTHQQHSNLTGEIKTREAPARFPAEKGKATVNAFESGSITELRKVYGEPEREKQRSFPSKPPTTFKSKVSSENVQTRRPATRIPVRNRSSLQRRVASHDGTRDRKRTDDVTTVGAHAYERDRSSGRKRQVSIRHDSNRDSAQVLERTPVNLSEGLFKQTRSPTRPKLMVNPQFQETFTSQL